MLRSEGRVVPVEEIARTKSSGMNNLGRMRKRVVQCVWGMVSKRLISNDVREESRQRPTQEKLEEFGFSSECE